MRILLTGASGQLGSYLTGVLKARGVDLVAWSGREAGERFGVPLRPVDLADPEGLDSALNEANPSVVIHAAALSTIEGVRLDPEYARAVNVRATGRIAEWCATHRRRLVYTSTDLVFDGKRPGGSYAEDDPTAPLTAYARSKWEGEASVLASPGGLVARMCLMYGPALGGRENYFDRTVAGLRSGTPQTFFSDEFRTPLPLPTAAEILFRLALSDVQGVLHVGGPERMSRDELGRRIARGIGAVPGLVRSNRQSDIVFPEPRAADVSLDTRKLRSLLPDLAWPTVEEAVAGMVGSSGLSV
ncbi:MAG: SDR family oxidoreductase [Isosphaeraceae bacterium]